MNVFVWKELGQVSDSYHSGGGLLIVAKDMVHAKALAAEHGHIVIDIDPDLEMRLAPDSMDNEARVIVFPDSGCC